MKRIDFFVKTFIIYLFLLLFTCEQKFRNPLDPNTELEPDKWAPKNLTAEAIDDSHIRLSWTQEESRIEGFIIERKDGPASYREIGRTDTIVFIDDSLKILTSYIYRISAYAEKNKSTPVVSSTIQTSLPAPTNLAATAINDQSIRISWLDNCSFESGFRIERKSGSGNFSQVAEVTANTTTYEESSLTYGETYTYRVRAYTTINQSAYSNENSAQMIIQAPTNLTVTAIDDQTIRLTWTDNCLFESGFKIERKAGSSDFSQVAEVNANTTNYEENGLTYGETYTYRVRAYTSINHSDYSNENTAQMIIVAPTDLNAEAIDDQTIRLTWTDNCSFESGFKIERKTGNEDFSQIAEIDANISNYNDNGLSNEVVYIYRVKAFTQNNESGYSNEMVDPWHVIDFDGNVYKTVKIGTQIWTAENLKVTHYRNGDPIPNVTDNTEWSNLTTGAYCNYNNDPTNAITYGKLYNWYAVADSRNLAPIGWHVPSDAEWQTLVNYLGGEEVAGGKMKEAGTEHWASPNTGATNESGFSALPGGMRSDTAFYQLGNDAYFWSVTDCDSYRAWEWTLFYNFADIYRNDLTTKLSGKSVRLVRD